MLWDRTSDGRESGGDDSVLQGSVLGPGGRDRG